jgi:hypothetical protein
MQFFWPIRTQIANYTIRKTEAAKTRIRVDCGHYIRLNLDVF